MSDENHPNDDISCDEMAFSVLGEDFKAALSTGKQTASNERIFCVCKGLNVHVNFNEVVPSKSDPAIEEITVVDGLNTVKVRRPHLFPHWRGPIGQLRRFFLRHVSTNRRAYFNLPFAPLGGICTGGFIN